MTTITGSCTLRGQSLNNVPVLNPGNWFGKAWLIEIGGGFDPLHLIVEADSVSDALDELSDSTYGHEVHVPDSNLKDYPEDERHYDGSGRVVDHDHVLVYELSEDATHYHVEGYPVPISPRWFSGINIHDVLKTREDAIEAARGPGKFEGEAIYVPYLWETGDAEPVYLNDAEPVYLNEDATDAMVEDRPDHWTIAINDDDLVYFPELEGREVVKMVEREDGLVVEAQ